MMKGEDGRVACGRAIAFVLALGMRPEGGVVDEVRTTVGAAREAGAPAVFVLASPACAADAIEAVRTSGRRGRALVQAIEYDPASAIALTRDAGDFELYGLPFGLLETMRVIAESVLDVYESVLVMDAAQTRITAEHLATLCLDARERPGVDVVASWIERLRRTPMLVSRDFLEGLADAPYAQPACGEGSKAGIAARDLPHIEMFDHVFGEERLAAPTQLPPSVASFLDRCTYSALEAVRLAKAVDADARAGYADARAGNPDARMEGSDARVENAGVRAEDADARAGRAGDAGVRAKLGNVDALLMQTAERVLVAAASMSAEDRAELEWANVFGERNRRDFPLLNADEHRGKLAYLDSAATSQRVEAALRAQRDFDERENANVYRGTYELSAQATRLFGHARATLAQFIGAEADEVTFTANTTAAINLVALAWGEQVIGAGDVIVCELAAHHANMLPFLMLAERKGARVEYVPYDDDGRLDRAAYTATLGLRPKLVCLAQVGNMLGIAAPVRALADEAHAAGARVLVDAAQSFPHEAIDVRELGADWVALSGHKAYGPLGIGALWSSPEAFAEMRPVCGGGGIVSHVSPDSYYLKLDSTRFEPGTPPISQAIGWAAAIDYLDGLGMENVARHAAALTRYAIRGLQRIDGVNVMGDHSGPDGWRGVVPFTVRSVAPGALGAFLGRLGVAIRSGGHCALPLHASLGLVGTGRISIGVHTTSDDIDAALAAIAVCRQAYES